MSLRRTTSTLSSEFLLCLFLKNRINSQQSFCQRALLWSDTLCYLSILFYFCIFEMFLKIYRKLKRKKKKTTIESSWQRSTELLLEKQLLLALSLSGGCGRRGQNTENMGLAVRTPRLRNQVGHLPVTGPWAHRVPSWASGSLHVKIPTMPPSRNPGTPKWATTVQSALKPP